MSKDPAFLMYSKDWIEGTAEYLPEEKGVYIDLLCYQHQKGDLPKDLNRLARLVRMTLDEFTPIWEVIKEKFIEIDERLVNDKLQEVMSERKNKGEKNRIIGVFGYLCRESEAKKSTIKQIRSEFKVADFRDVPSERLTERLTEWFNSRLASLEDEDVNIDIDYKRLINIFNQITGKNTKVVNDKAKSQIRARLKEGYKKQDIITAITNCYRDEYHIETKHKYLTLEFITRPDKLDKFHQTVKERKYEAIL